MRNRRLRNDFYEGPIVNTKSTSIKGRGPSPTVRFLVINDSLPKDSVILDYGAGRYSRNANFLRERGYTVYAYDPYHGEPDVDGFDYGCISNTLPDRQFDIVLTVYVLNVVPRYEEINICEEAERIATQKVIHVTRNLDIYKDMKASVRKKSKIIYKYFREEYQGGKEPSDPSVLDMCYFGIITSKGFQRIPTTEDFGYNLIKRFESYKIYEKYV